MSVWVSYVLEYVCVPVCVVCVEILVCMCVYVLCSCTCLDGLVSCVQFYMLLIDGMSKCVCAIVSVLM